MNRNGPTFGDSKIIFDGEEELEGRHNKKAKRSYTASGIFGQCEFSHYKLHICKIHTHPTFNIDLVLNFRGHHTKDLTPGIGISQCSLVLNCLGLLELDGTFNLFSSSSDGEFGERSQGLIRRGIQHYRLVFDNSDFAAVRVEGLGREVEELEGVSG